MAKYTLISSRDGFSALETARYYDLARDLKKAGNEVTLFLVQNGVFGARKSAAPALSRLAGEGVTVLADAFSLKERGIGAAHLAEGVQSAPLDTVVDHLAEGRKVVWH